MTPDDFLRLSEAGLTPKQIALVMEIMTREAKEAADKEEARKAKGRERWHRWHNKREPNVSQREQTLANDSRGGVARVEDNLQTKEISGQEDKTNTTAPKARVSDLAEFKAELSDLDSERLEAIVKHRRSKRGQLTGHAARLFRSDATACGLSIAEAVDACISRNWITVKPEYLAGRNVPPRRSTSPPAQERTVSDVLGEMAAGTWKPPGNDHEPATIETSFHRRN